MEKNAQSIPSELEKRKPAFRKMQGIWLSYRLYYCLYVLLFAWNITWFYSSLNQVENWINCKCKRSPKRDCFLNLPQLCVFGEERHKWEGEEADNVAFFVLFNIVFFFTYVVCRLWSLYAWLTILLCQNYCWTEACFDHTNDSLLKKFMYWHLIT